jgi:hypothetical protein
MCEKGFASLVPLGGDRRETVNLRKCVFP